MTMTTPTLCAFLTGSRIQHGLALAIVGCVLAVLVLAWCFRFSHTAGKLPTILFTGVLPLFLFAVMWPQSRLSILASLIALLLTCIWGINRRALHLLRILFTGLIPVFLLIAVDDPAWSAGFLLVYLGLTSLEPPMVEKDNMIITPAMRACCFVHYVSLGFLWILLFAALLWYVPEPLTGA